MIYQCTKDMLKALKVEQTDKPDIYSELFSWNVKIMKVKRRNLVYLMNDASKLSVIFYGMTAKEFKKFDEYVKTGIQKVFKDCGVTDQAIEDYLEQAGEAIFTSSGTRKQRGVLNTSALETEFLIDEFLEDSLLQRRLCVQRNNSLVKNDNGDYVTPKEMIKNLLDKNAGNADRFDLGDIALYMFSGDLMGMDPFLNIRDGSIYVAEENSKEYDDLEYDEDYIRIFPEPFGFLHHFNRFARGIDNEKFHRDLERVRLGRGAVRRIKDLLHRYPEIREKWYEYEEEAQEELVKEWLESQGLM